MSRHVSEDTRYRVIRWLDYNWTQRPFSVPDDVILGVLPASLRAEVVLQVHREPLSRVGIFTDCDPVTALLRYVTSRDQVSSCDLTVSNQYYGRFSVCQSTVLPYWRLQLSADRHSQQNGAKHNFLGRDSKTPMQILAASIAVASARAEVDRCRSRLRASEQRASD